MSIEVRLTVPTFFQGRARHSYAVTDPGPAHWQLVFRLFKVGFDVALALLALPFIAAITLLLVVANPVFNPGPVFFRQERLGRNRRSFHMWKFRTMRQARHAAEIRPPDAGVEEDRITPLGRILRRTRIDELPNFFNVLRGEMSVIGPRPDARCHAEAFLDTIPHYAFRYLVKPGITGLAQVEAGYAEGTAATAIKAHYDQLYVETSCARLDIWIALRTAYVVCTGMGAK